MNGEVQLIVGTKQLSTVVTLNDSLTAAIVSGDSFCFGASGLSALYTVGSKIEIVDQSVSPEVILFTRYVTGYNDATGEISVNQPFTSNVATAAIYVYTLAITDAISMTQHQNCTQSNNQ